MSIGTSISFIGIAMKKRKLVPIALIGNLCQCSLIFFVFFVRCSNLLPGHAYCTSSYGASCCSIYVWIMIIYKSLYIFTLIHQGHSQIQMDLST
ncbi:hypothetical protein ACET3Z_024831 [Daucus carota]